VLPAIFLPDEILVYVGYYVSVLGTSTNGLMLMIVGLLFSHGIARWSSEDISIGSSMSSLGSINSLASIERR
jgi:hypothetical protein